MVPSELSEAVMQVLGSVQTDEEAVEAGSSEESGDVSVESCDIDVVVLLIECVEGLDVCSGVRREMDIAGQLSPVGVRGRAASELRRIPPERRIVFRLSRS